MSEEGGAGWGGVVSMGSWWLLYRGVYGPTRRHAHHAVQIISSNASVTVRYGAGDEIAASTVVVPSDLAHEISSSGFATMVFVDADSTAGRQLGARCEGSPISLDLPAPSGSKRSEAIVSGVLALVDDAPNPAPAGAAVVSSGVAAALAELADAPGAGSVVEFAARSGLSPSRFSQRFAREVGIPMRRYRRWVRMLHAIEALSTGASLTTAAHEAGFTDSAHLTHTFRDHFGMAPSGLLATSRFEPPS